MIPSKNTQRVPLQNGVAHFAGGTLRLRRFRKPDQGGADFVMRGSGAISALLNLQTVLSDQANRIAEPGYQCLSDEYVVYWTPAKKAGLFLATLAFEPMGLPAVAPPFSLTLDELKHVASAIRAASKEEKK